MKEGWKYKKLGEVCDFQNGFAFKSNLFADKGIGVVRISDIQNGEVSKEKMTYVNPKSIKEDLSSFIVRPNDILIAMSGGTTGKLGINKTNETFFQNQRVGLFREHKEVLNHTFLYYFLCTKSEESLKIAAGAAQPNLSTIQIKQFQIPVPSLPDQQRIVSYLDAEFAKIEALKANAEKQLQTAKDLFQAALKELLTPKEGWVEKKLGDLCSICGEYGLNESATNYNGVRYLRITDITDDGELNNDKVSAQNKGKKNQEELEVGDILFARTGATVGKTLVYRKEFGKCVFAGYLIRYRTNPNIILPQFLFYYTHSTKYYDWVKNNQAAAAQPNISAQKYNCLIIAFPKDTAEQQRIADRLDALSANVKALQTNYTETITLCNDLKQALLKKVFG